MEEEGEPSHPCSLTAYNTQLGALITSVFQARIDSRLSQLQVRECFYWGWGGQFDFLLGPLQGDLILPLCCDLKALLW